jgi:DNA-3-methyladenine glycosylase
VARALLGALIVSVVDGTEAIGRIVETEAYLGPDDDASHAARRIGRTQRNATMFGLPGIAYVYRSYGIHWCLNVVTDRPGFPAAVLIRAIEPVAGIAIMRERRELDALAPDHAIGRGPGNLTRALGITGVLDGHSLDRVPLMIVRGRRVSPASVMVGPRIGISRARDLPLRFWIRSNPNVSGRPG